MSRSRSSNVTVLIALVAIVSVALDQWSKAFVTSHLFFDGNCLPLCGHKNLIPGWLQIAPIPNRHGAFGMFGSNTVLLTAMAVAVLVIFWLSFKDAARRSWIVCVAFGLIVGGALGNIADRFTHGFVVDFIDFYRYPDIWRFTFNVADSCITIGVIFLLLSSLGRTRRHA